MGIKVLLVGGTSHVGKSMLAARLAATLTWDLLSTDKLARHPGRPWRDDRSELPADVVAYYSSASADELVDSVVQHYRRNVWPIAGAIVRSHLNNSFAPHLVLEGSAILPEMVSESRFERSSSAWLTTSAELIRERILQSSRYNQRSPSERKLIEAFAARSLSFNEFIKESAERLGQRCIDVNSSDPLPNLLRLAQEEPV